MKLTSEIKQEYQKGLIDTFRRTVDFLNSHNLRWWCAYGTAIGAVRHHGIIPWDDDVDIFMPYEDYCKLLKLTNANEYNLQIDLPLSDTNVCPWGKITDVNSTIWQFEYNNAISGLWIDVFPLYSINKTGVEHNVITKEYQKLYSSYELSSMKFVPREFLGLITGFRLLNIKQRIKGVLLYSWRHKKIKNEYLTFLDSINEPGGKYLIAPQEPNDIFPSDWFSSTYKVSFEDYEVYLPVGNDKVLTQMFGDYMTPPPEGNRGTLHSFFFIDLNKRFTKEEILSLLKK